MTVFSVVGKISIFILSMIIITLHPAVLGMIIIIYSTIGSQDPFIGRIIIVVLLALVATIATGLDKIS